MRASLFRITLTTLAIVLLASCSRHGAVATDQPIIIISVDTLRSDHLPAYGYSKIETPAIDSLRNDSILFERAYSHCPLTLVSHASVFTGELPAEHGIRDNLGYDLDPKAHTLAELMKSKGYATGAAVSALVLRGETGIKRGFDFYDDNIDLDPAALSIGRAQRSGDVTREVAQKWIGEHKGKPFFFFLHLYEPHSPYEPVEPFRSRYQSAYDAEIATADEIVGKFLNYLRDEGLYEKSTIIFMSDHGEGLGEHGEDEHGLLLYREAIQVPLILKLPKGSQKGSSVAAPVELIDIFPTISDAFGAKGSHPGRSLLDTASGKFKDERPIYSETYYPRLHFGWSDMHSLISGANHYIHAPKAELYDVASDPAETKNVLMENRRAYVSLRERIQPFIHAAAKPSAVDDEQKQQLVALGYVGSTVSTSSDAVLPDAHENIGKANDIGKLFRSFKADKFEEVVSVSDSLLRENKQMLDVWSLRARALERLNRAADAVDAAKQALRLQPDSSQMALIVANLSLHLGKLDDAEGHAKLALKEAPAEAHRILCEVAMARKDYVTARKEAELTGGEKRDRPITLILRGRIAQDQGDFASALKEFDEAISVLEASKRKPLPKLYFYRGDMLARLGRSSDAEQAFQTEIKYYPTDPQTYKNLILLYVTEGKNEEATNLIFSLEKASPTPPSYVAIAETLKTIGDARGSRFWAARGLNRYPQDHQLQSLVRG